MGWCLEDNKSGTCLYKDIGSIEVVFIYPTQLKDIEFPTFLIFLVVLLMKQSINIVISVTPNSFAVVFTGMGDNKLPCVVRVCNVSF